MKKMRSKLLASAISFALGAPAFAANNSILPVCASAGSCGGTSTSEVFANKDIGPGVKYPENILVDSGAGDVTDPTNHVIWVDARAGGGLLTALANGTGTPGSGVPSSALYNGINVAGNLRGATGVNPSGSIFATQIDLASLAGTPLVSDPCKTAAKTYTSINISSATTVSFASATGDGKKGYVCGMFLFGAAAQNVAVVNAPKTSAACDGTKVGMIGGNTAAAGINLVANQGWVLPVTGYAYASSSNAGDDTCLVTSASAQLSGVVVSVRQ